MLLLARLAIKSDHMHDLNALQVQNNNDGMNNLLSRSTVHCNCITTVEPIQSVWLVAIVFKPQ